MLYLFGSVFPQQASQTWRGSVEPVVNYRSNKLISYFAMRARLMATPFVAAFNKVIISFYENVGRTNYSVNHKTVRLRKMSPFLKQFLNKLSNITGKSVSWPNESGRATPLIRVDNWLTNMFAITFQTYIIPF